MPIRNHHPERVCFLNKSHCKHLTTQPAVTLLAVIAWFTVCLHTNSNGQSASTHPYLTASAIALHQQLQSPCEQMVKNDQLESLLSAMAENAKIQIWFDRRISRDRTISLKEKTETLEGFLSRVVEQVDGDIIPLQGILMISPKEKRDAIEAAYWRLLQSNTSPELTRIDREPFQWSDAATGSEVLESFFSRYVAKLATKPEVELDLWQAHVFKKIPPTSLSVCLLSGFDLALGEKNGESFVFKLSEPERDQDGNFQVEWVYTKTDIAKIGKAYWTDWKTRWPESRSKEKQAGWQVTATPQSHRDLVRPLIPIKKAEKKTSSGKFSGPIRGQLERVLATLSNQFRLEFSPLPLPPNVAIKDIDMNLNNSTLDDILREIEKQAGIELRRTDQKVQILFP